MSSWHGGKGSDTRPSQVDKEVADLRYDLAFGKPEQKEKARQRLIELGVIKNGTTSTTPGTT